MATLITFVRHGATDWNRDARFQGQVDIPLNAHGRAQAAALARALGRERFDRAVTSDLSRAIETARAIRRGASVTADARWREFAFGEWEGLTWEQIAARWPEACAAGLSARSYSPPGGESFAAVLARVGSALDDLTGGADESILVVTHAGPLHAALQHLFGGRADVREMLSVRFTPASVTRIAVEAGGAELISLNDIAHLR